MKKFLKKNTRVLVTFFIGTVMVLGILGLNGGFLYESLRESMKDLCDAFSITGFLLIALGLLVFVSNDGGFSMLSYSIKKIFSVFKKDPTIESYYEYKKAKMEKPAPFKYLFIVGIVYFLIGMIFLIIFYQVIK